MRRYPRVLAFTLVGFALAAESGAAEKLIRQPLGHELIDVACAMAGIPIDELNAWNDLNHLNFSSQLRS